MGISFQEAGLARRPTSAPLLITKLHAPSPRRNAVRRSALENRLDEGVRLGRRLTLVSAPAGYGKTTLVRDWLAAASLPSTWLSLEPADDDPVRFFTYLVASIRRLGDIGRSTDSLLGAGHLPPVDLLISTLINELADLQSLSVLVLDDLHAVRDSYIHQGLESLIEHLPATLHVVVTTRQDPPLPLARLRARGLLTEIRLSDLRFRKDETERFFSDTMGLPLAPELVRALGARTEGWVAGLQLAALSLQKWDPARAGEFVREFTGNHRYVIDYLIDEVLRLQSDAVREFLQATAFLDRFTGALCDAVTGRSDSQQLLEQLEEANLFLVPLDQERRWYRYHHLFADALRASSQHLQPPHLVAARWFEDNGLLAEAVKHALASGDSIEGSRLVGRAAAVSFRTGELATLLNWIAALPADTVRADATLATYQAWALFLSGSVDRAFEIVSTLERDTSGLDPVSRGRLLGLQAWLANVQGRPEVGALAREALDLIGEDDYVFRIAALHPLGHSRFTEGDLKGAIEVFQEAYRLGMETGQHLAAASAVTNLAFYYNDCGRRLDALAICRDGLARFTDGLGRLSPAGHLILIPYGVLLYEGDELAEARPQLTKALEMCRRLFSDTMMGGDAEVTLALLDFAEGNTERSLETILDLRRSAEKMRLKWLVTGAEAFEARLRLRLGDVAAASAWAERTGIDTFEDDSEWRRVQTVTYSSLLLAQGRFDEALARLDAFEARARQRGSARTLLNVLAVKAQVLWASAQPGKAAEAMREAIRIAAPQGYRRALLDEGPGLAPLLTEVRGEAPDFVGELLRALGAAPTRQAARGRGLPEALSDRETEVLKLIADGHSNEEIARRLFITVGTAKWHVHNIFEKLGVARRTQVVARARELNLL